VKKGVVLVIVMGIMFFVVTLALVAAYLMTQQSRISEHKIRRTRTLFAARAGMVLALEELRKNDCGGTGNCLSRTAYPFTIGAGLSGYPLAGISGTYTWTDDDSGPNNTDPIQIQVTH